MDASEIWLARVEQRLRTELEQGDMPFLGLYSSHFDQKSREYFHEKVLGHSAPIKRFISGLGKWPAAFATYLTVHVVEGYGRAGTGEVYPFIEEALGASAAALDQPRRVDLWQAYRKACIQLGLSVVPAGSSARPYVDEYLRQAGVPIKYLSQLTTKLESHSIRLGVPGVEDPEAIVAWQEQLHGYLGPPISRTIPRAIETDETAYYTTTYLRVREYEKEEECQNETEGAIFEALSNSTSTRQIRAAQIPELQWRNGAIGIQIPRGDNSKWQLITTISGEDAPVSTTLIAENEEQFVSLPAGFPLRVAVEGPKASFKFPIWEDEKDNRAMLVDRLGRVRVRAALGDGEIQLLPGSYSLITRWKPAGEGLEPIQLAGSPALFESAVTISSGATLLLERGPAQLRLTGKSIAAMEWQGLAKTGVLGREMLASKDLSITGTIPAEIEAAAPGMFELVITARDINKQAEIPIEVDINQSFRVNLAEILSSWPLVLFRASVVIRRRDIPNRAFARMSGLIWNGLSSTDGIHFRFESERAFEKTNIARVQCENVRFDKDGLTFRDDQQRYFRIVFDLSASESVAFTWLVPGLFLSLLEPRDQTLDERPLAKRSVIQVKPSSRSALKVYSTLEGVIKIGEYRKSVSANAISGVQLYLAPLLEHMTAGDRAVQFIGETGVPINLLMVVTPHQYSSVSTVHTADVYKVVFTIADQIDELSVEAVEMMSGSRRSFELQVNVLESATGRALEKVWAVSQEAGNRSTRIEINWNINDWETGAYVFRIRAKVANRWGDLVNARGDVFVGSFVTPLSADSPLYSLVNRPISDLLDIFQRFTEFLLECYSEESWGDVKWIADTWHEVARGLDVTDRQVLIRLATLALRRAPEHSPPSWAPISSVMAERLDVFAQPAAVYERLPTSELRGSSVLRSLGRFGTNDQENFARDDLFSPLALLGFENGSSVANCKEARLKSFSVRRFGQTGVYEGDSERLRIRRREEWMPGPGLYLGAKHYWWAVNKLELNFSAGFAGNEHRRGNVLRLANRLKACGWRDKLPQEASHLVRDQVSLGSLHQRVVDEDMSQEEENILALIDLISATAFACRVSARQNDVLAEYENSLAAAIDTTKESLRSYLGYALYIGIDLFLYYLLLWEFVLSRDFDEVTDFA